MSISHANNVAMYVLYMFFFFFKQILGSITALLGPQLLLLVAPYLIV